MSNTNNNASASASINFSGLLLVVLIVLKLNPGGHLDSPVEDWSWWLVIFAPLLLSLAMILVFLVIIAIGVGIGATIAWIIDRYKNAKRNAVLKKREEERKARIAQRKAGDSRLS